MRTIVLALAMLCGSASADSTSWFQKTEQALMDAVASGNKSVWDQVMDSSCVLTSEEGQVMSKKELLAQLRPLPPGLTGAIAVKELTVQEFPSFAVVRYLADESEIAFGQRLATKYRLTDTFRREGDTWKMVASHVAVVTQDPPAQDVSTADWPALAGFPTTGHSPWSCATDVRGGERPCDPHRQSSKVRAADLDPRFAARLNRVSIQTAVPSQKGVFPWISLSRGSISSGHPASPEEPLPG